jgi:group I intron endonuclease
MICLIYKIVNLINNKIYIGQTWQSLKIRLIKHKSSNFNCIKLHHAINKYGRDNFKIELITICHTQLAADYWEEYFIKKFDSIKNGYNILMGGKTGSRKGLKHSKETKQKISDAKKGRPSSLKGKVGCMKGRKHTEDAKKNMSKAKKLSPHTGKSMLGKHHSEESKHKSSLSNLGLHKGKTWKLINDKRVWIEREI